jgi:hypothetical protein
MMPANFARASGAMTVMIKGYEKIEKNEDKGEQVTAVRDTWRNCLRQEHPGEYPVGDEGADIATLSHHLLGVGFLFPSIASQWTRCERREVRPDLNDSPITTYNVVGRFDSIQAWMNSQPRCLGICSDCDGEMYGVHDIGKVLCCQFLHEDVSVDWNLNVRGTAGYSLAGIIYFGGSHFVSRIITAVGKVYSHDRMDRTLGTFNGLLGHKQFTDKDLKTFGTRKAIIAVYLQR